MLTFVTVLLSVMISLSWKVFWPSVYFSEAPLRHFSCTDCNLTWSISSRPWCFTWNKNQLIHLMYNFFSELLPVLNNKRATPFVPSCSTHYFEYAILFWYSKYFKKCEPPPHESNCINQGTKLVKMNLLVVIVICQFKSSNEEKNKMRS